MPLRPLKYISLTRHQIMNQYLNRASVIRRDNRKINSNKAKIETPYKSYYNWRKSVFWCNKKGLKNLYEDFTEAIAYGELVKNYQKLNKKIELLWVDFNIPVDNREKFRKKNWRNKDNDSYLAVFLFLNL